MVGGVVINGLMGLVYCILLLFSASSLDRLRQTATGFLFMEIYLDVTRSRAGATVMSLTLVVVTIAANVAGTTSTSRTLWAFARDRATPGHEYLSYVNPKLPVPVHAVLFTVASQAFLGLLYLGNETAFNAVLSMAIIGLYLSYILPIAYMLIYGRNPQKQDLGYFRLSPWLGIALNSISMAWMILVMIFSTFPTTLPVTPQTMNYSSIVLVGWVGFGVLYYTTAARHKFKVPIPKIDGVPDDMTMPVLNYSKHDHKRL